VLSPCKASDRAVLSELVAQSEICLLLDFGHAPRRPPGARIPRLQALEEQAVQGRALLAYPAGQVIVGIEVAVRKRLSRSFVLRDLLSIRDQRFIVFKPLATPCPAPGAAGTPSKEDLLTTGRESAGVVARDTFFLRKEMPVGKQM